MLVKICAIDTTPRADVAEFARNESAVCDILEEAFNTYGFEAAQHERRPMNPDIEKHSFYSQLYYTKTADNPNGMTATQCYGNRSNLLLLIDGEQSTDRGINYAINAHIDVIAPYFPPRVEGDTVFGRGSCDDKGNIVALMGALKLVSAWLKDNNKRINRHLTCMLVLDEESGGNGSLSLAIDSDLKKRYDSLTVLEICENKLFPGNRGCVWYKIEAKTSDTNLFEVAAYIIEEMEKEGRSLRSESRHDLFPHRPVQTCHGIIGGSGEHPSRINGDVSFDIVGPRPPSSEAKTLITDVIQFALNEYCGVYGDKTKINDPGTGKPKVDHHYDMTETDDGYTVRVYGASGHMGSILENDGAITKMMTMVRSLMRSRAAIEREAGGTVFFRQTGWSDISQLILEGGQGFLPTHEMADVQNRLIAAVHHGAERGGYDAEHFEVTFEKLHNAAFAGSVDSIDMQNAIECAKQAGMWEDQPIRGWDVSCDSRIFAKQYEDLNVITTGPGSLNYAHGDFEQIDIPEMIRFAQFLAYYILKQTGTVE
jgi:acetylornithine deacetylase/succinyl-diaminopimelate desuccinylase-like protein